MQLHKEDKRSGQIGSRLLRPGKGQFVSVHGLRSGLHSHQQFLQTLHDITQERREDVLVSRLQQGFHEERQHAGPFENHTQTIELVPFAIFIKRFCSYCCYISKYFFKRICIQKCDLKFIFYDKTRLTCILYVIRGLCDKFLASTRKKFMG